MPSAATREEGFRDFVNGMNGVGGNGAMLNDANSWRLALTGRRAGLDVFWLVDESSSAVGLEIGGFTFKLQQ